MPRPSSFPFPEPLNLSSPGARTRVLLGDTGSEFVMVASPDDGTTQWQAVVSGGGAGSAMGGLLRQIENCKNKDRYLTAIDYHTGTRAWYVAGQKVDGTGWHSWHSPLGSEATELVRRRAQVRARVSLGSARDEQGNLQDTCVVVTIGGNDYEYNNIPTGLLSRMRWIKNRNHPIHRVKLFERGGYFIWDGVGKIWDGLQPGVSNELAKAGRVLDVAIAKNGSWVVIRDNHFTCSPGIASDLVNYLDAFYTRQKSRIERREQEILEHNARLALEAQGRERRRQQLEAEARELERLEAEAVAANVLETLRPLRDELSTAGAEAERHRERTRALHESMANQLETLHPDARAIAEERLGWNELVASSSSTGQAPAGGRSSSPSTEAVRAVASCVICTDHPAIRALVPCGHLCLCEACSTQLFQSSSSSAAAPACPLCRRAVTSTLRIYRQDI